MRLRHVFATSLCASAVLGCRSTLAVDTSPATAAAEAAIAFPQVIIDRQQRQVRVECEAVMVEMPLEFFCVVRNGPEHETVLRTDARPSHIHAALLMLGLEPGAPTSYSEATRSWQPPRGPPVRITVEFAGKDGQLVSMPAERMVRDLRTKKPMPPTSWVFTGSRLRESDGVYLADPAGYVVSIVNFDLTLLDVPKVASSADETLEWETNPDLGLKRGDKVTMILEPVGGGATTAAAEQGEPAPAPAPVESRRSVTELREEWRAAVRPHHAALREAAQTHYRVISDLRKRQQTLIDEADRLQRLIDELEREYADLTTPQAADVPASRPAP